MEFFHGIARKGRECIEPVEDKRISPRLVCCFISIIFMLLLSD